MESEKKNKYLIIPSMPTPNGPLHLGHVGGPYLNADILARYLRLCGHEVALLSGTDCYESFVSLQADVEKVAEERIAEKYYRAISADLMDMQINFDTFINPLSPEWLHKFQTWHYFIYNQLQTSVALQKKTEALAWDSAQARYLSGCWLQGHCPYCQAEISGYFCDRCYGHFRPEQIPITASHCIDHVEHDFLKLPAYADLTRHGIQSKVQTNYKKFLQQQSGLMRLSTSMHWGLKLPKNKIFFSYSFGYAYCLFLGDVARQFLSIDDNPFSINSRVHTVMSFGIDNAIPILSSILGITSVCSEFKSVDSYIVNYFYHLNATKFSTSRRHAIWVQDIINKAHANSDFIRWYLAAIDTHTEHNNFDSVDFIQQYNTMVEDLSQLVLKPLASIVQPTTSQCDPRFLEQFQHAKNLLSQTLQPNQCLPHLAVATVAAWLEFGKWVPASELYWWLKALAILSNPFMPNFSQQLWNALGYINSPQLNNFLTLPQTRIIPHLHMNMQRMNQNLIEKCIKGALDEAV